MEWDEHASTWDEDPAARAYSRAAFDSLRVEAARRDVTISGARVCDFGCGTGLLTEQLAADATHIDAVDASPAMLDALREKVARNGWTHVDTLGGPRGAGGHYDLIVCSSVCAFLDDYPGTVRHLASLLRPDGLFVQWDWELGPEDAEEYGLSRDEIRDALAGAGLRSVRVETAFRIPMGDVTMAPLMGSGRRR